MKVRELIELLTDYDPDAEVTIAHQPHYPFEYSLSGVTDRASVVREDAVEDLPVDQYGYPIEDDLNESGIDYGEHNLGGWERSPKAGTDVILVEGSQLSYASPNIWNVVTR